MADQDEVYTVYLMDKVKFEPEFTQEIMNAVALELGIFFNQVIKENKTPYKEAIAVWNRPLGAVKEGEIVIYFHANPDAGKAQNYAAGNHLTSSGAAVPTPAGALAEVYFTGFKGDAHAGRLGAIIAFHEAMHVKLEFGKKKIVSDIHSQGGGAAAKADKITYNDVPNTRNKQLMSQALSLPVPQYI